MTARENMNEDEVERFRLIASRKVAPVSSVKCR